jgi:hypothetical protein
MSACDVCLSPDASFQLKFISTGPDTHRGRDRLRLRPSPLCGACAAALESADASSVRLTTAVDKVQGSAGDDFAMALAVRAEEAWMALLRQRLEGASIVKL